MGLPLLPKLLALFLSLLLLLMGLDQEHNIANEHQDLGLDQEHQKLDLFKDL